MLHKTLKTTKNLFIKWPNKFFQLIKKIKNHLKCLVKHTLGGLNRTYKIDLVIKDKNSPIKINKLTINIYQ